MPMVSSIETRQARQYFKQKSLNAQYAQKTGKKAKANIYGYVT